MVPNTASSIHSKTELSVGENIARCSIESSDISIEDPYALNTKLNGS